MAAALAAALAAGMWLSPPAAAGQRVLPLDPLTAAERETAVSVAQGDERVRRAVEGREFAVAYAELLVLKAERATDTPERPAVQGRHAEVLISVYGNGFTGVRAVVDLQRRAVTEVGIYTPARVGAEARSEGTPFRVPFSDAERQMAREVALRSPEVRALLGRNAEAWQVDGLPITQPDREFCPSGRCLLMIFNRGDTYLTSSVIVDVTTRTARVMQGPR